MGHLFGFDNIEMNPLGHLFGFDNKEMNPLGHLFGFDNKKMNPLGHLFEFDNKEKHLTGHLQQSTKGSFGNKDLIANPKLRTFRSSYKRKVLQGNSKPSHMNDLGY